jgi:glycerate 2-kinase
MMSFNSRILRRRETLAQREQILSVLQAALDAVDPVASVKAQLRREGDRLYVGGREYHLGRYRHIYVIGGGKAGAAMARAVEEVLGDHLTGGLVNVKHGHLAPTRLVQVNQAGHPLPDAVGVRGAQEILDLARQATADDLVLCLLSGGASALMPAPAPGLDLSDLQSMNDALLRCGATIVELNAIRKHLSAIKGGRLAQAAQPAEVISLILSDVVGNPLDVIASGPTVPDPTTFADAAAVVDRYDLWDELPQAVADHLRRGRDGYLPETPKAGDPTFERTCNVIVGSNTVAAEAALGQAKALGFNALLLSTYVEGEAREVAQVFVGLAKEELYHNRPVPRPACLIIGGETTVTVRGDGKGGRNQELALAAAIQIAGLEDVAIVALATDGTDGPTDAAGAIADGSTVDRAAALGLSPTDHLRRNDAYPFFDLLDDLLLTGPTNTNVNDLTFVFVFGSR